MRREHKNPEPIIQDTILWLKLDGDFVDSISGVDIAAMYGWPNSNYRNYSFVDDPTGVGGKGLRRSQTAGGGGNLQSLPWMTVDPRSYRTDYPNLFKIFKECSSSSDNSGVFSYLIGLTLEFEVYIVSQTGNRYILESYDGLYGNNSQMYGVELYRNGTTLNVKTTSGVYNLYTLSNNTRYKFSLDFVEVNTTTFKVVVKLYSNDVLLTTYTTPNIIMGSNNRNNRALLFFNSQYGYYATAANLKDLLRNVKVKYTQV